MCNIDPSFSAQYNKVGITVYKDDRDIFVLAEMDWLSPICDVDVGATLSLLGALN
jgi:hypothetical protein